MKARQTIAMARAGTKRSPILGRSFQVPVSWFTFGRRSGCCKFKRNKDEEDGFPMEVGCCCCRLVILSGQHSLLLFSSLVSIIMVTLNTLEVLTDGKLSSGNQHPKRYTSEIALLVESCLVLLCVLTMLVKFEDLDEVQRLEREVKELTKQNLKIEKQREEMKQYWNNVQQLSEVWLYRTVPRLDLYKEIHSQLEDARSDTILSGMRDTNQCLDLLEERLPALPAWKNEGSLNQEQKKYFGSALNRICQEPELDTILVKLHVIAESPVKQLSNSPTTNGKLGSKTSNTGSSAGSSAGSSVGSFAPHSSFASEVTGSFHVAVEKGKASGNATMSRLKAGANAFTKVVSPR
jgi:hypothetical protein